DGSTKSGSVSISIMKMNGTDEMFFAFYGKRNPCAPVSPRALLGSDFTRTYGGSDHVTGQASFEAETHNQSRRRKGAGRPRTEFFAGGECICIQDAHSHIPQTGKTPPQQRFVLSEEEMVDVSLATFYVFDKENIGSGVQLACGCGGCGRGGGGGGVR